MIDNGQLPKLLTYKMPVSKSKTPVGLSLPHSIAVPGYGALCLLLMIASPKLALLCTHSAAATPKKAHQLRAPD